MIKILLTDDHELVRTGIKRLLESSQQIKCVGEAASGEACLGIFQELKPDIILMDVNMPGIGGVEATRKILEREPTQKIIILTVHDELAFSKRLLSIGAQGYLTKECNISSMINAIKQVHSGSTFIEQSIADKLAASLDTKKETDIVDRLSQREIQVMLMTSRGKTNLEISEVLNISVKTVDAYLNRVMKKLDVNNEVEMVRIAVETGMVEFASGKSD